MACECILVESDVDAGVVKAEAKDRAHLVGVWLQVVDVEVDLCTDLGASHLITHSDDKCLNLINTSKECIALYDMPVLVNWIQSF